MSVKGRESDRALVAAFLELAEGTQEEKAALLDVDRSSISKWKRAVGAGKDVALADVTRERMESVVARLRGVDPYSNAYRAGVADAMKVLTEAAGQLEALLASVPRSPEAHDDESGTTEGAVDAAAEADQGRGPGRHGAGGR